MSPSPQTIKLLPLLLAPDKGQEIPIVISGCKKLILHELVYRNKSQSDLILACAIHVNGKVYRYQKSKYCNKTYLPEGEDRQFEIAVDPETDIKVGLEVTCGDFSLCNCKENRFQLNLSAVYQ